MITRPFLAEAPGNDQQLRSLLNAIPDLMFQISRDGTFLGYKADHKEDLALPPDRFLGKKVHQVMPREVADRTMNCIRRAIRSGRVEVFEYQLKSKGRTFVCEARMVSSGRDQLLTLVRDITRRKEMEEKLTQSERFYHTMFSLSPSGIIIADTEGVVIDVNPAGCRFLGYTRQELIGLKLYHLAHPDSLAALDRIIIRLLAGRTVRHAVTARRRDGSSCHLELNAKKFILPDGRDGFLFLCDDISARIRAEAELRDSEEKYRSLFDISPEGIMLFNLRGDVLSVNDRVCAIYGAPEKVILNRTIRDIVPPEISGKFPRLVQNLRRRKQLFFESQGRRFDGEIFPVELSVNLFRWRGEEMVQVLVKDITRRKRAERELKMLAQALKGSGDCVSITDIKNRILFANQAFLKTYGYTKHELLGKSIRTVRSSRTTRGTDREILPATLGGGWRGEVLNRRKDGTEFPVALSTSVVRDEDRRPIALIGIARDITERKRAEEQIRRAQEDLEKANQELKELDELKSKFVSMVSHELRTPLASIRLGLSQIIEGKLDEADRREVLAIALDESERLIRIINNLLDISRIEARKIVLNRKRIKLEALARKTAAAFRGEALKRGIALEVKSRRDLPSVYGDRDRLEQVLVNLVGNALKFTPSGGRIAIGFGRRGGMVRCTVSDTGVGFSRAELAQLFTKFRQFARPGSGGENGSGLGLAINKELVELHGGTISVKSLPKRGSSFTFTVPVGRGRKSKEPMKEVR